MLEFKIYLFPQYWTWQPEVHVTHCNNLLMADLIFLVFGIGFHQPKESPEGQTAEDNHRVYKLF